MRMHIDKKLCHFFMVNLSSLLTLIFIEIAWGLFLLLKFKFLVDNWIKNRHIGCIWGVHRAPKIGCFFQITEIQHSCCFNYSAHKKATAMVFIWGDRGYHAVRFEYKTASERYLVAELWAKQFWVFFEQIEVLNFFENTQKCFAYISATKYRSEAVLYSKRTAGYPLSPHIMTIAVAFLQAE